MNGWKTKAAGIAAILGGLATVIGGLVANGLSMEALATAKIGGGAIVSGLGLLGIGHKLDKLTNALEGK